MSANGDAPDEDYVREISEKARRLSHARRRKVGVWRHAAHVGSLGFVFAVPLVSGAVLGHIVAERTGRPALSVALILVGLIAGGLGSWQLIRRSLGEDAE